MRVAPQIAVDCCPVSIPLLSIFMLPNAQFCSLLWHLRHWLKFWQFRTWTHTKLDTARFATYYCLCICFAYSCNSIHLSFNLASNVKVVITQQTCAINSCDELYNICFDVTTVNTSLLQHFSPTHFYGTQVYPRSGLWVWMSLSLQSVKFKTPICQTKKQMEWFY